jgi:hypothetical protein
MEGHAERRLDEGGRGDAARMGENNQPLDHGRGERGSPAMSPMVPIAGLGASHGGAGGEGSRSVSSRCTNLYSVMTVLGSDQASRSVRPTSHSTMGEACEGPQQCHQWYHSWASRQMEPDPSGLGDLNCGEAPENHRLEAEELVPGGTATCTRAPSSPLGECWRGCPPRAMGRCLRVGAARPHSHGRAGDPTRHKSFEVW